jgi:hypothetical protein
LAEPLGVSKPEGARVLAATRRGERRNPTIIQTIGNENSHLQRNWPLQE